MVSINFNKTKLWQNLGINTSEIKQSFQEDKNQLRLRNDLEIDGFFKTEENKAKKSYTEIWKNENDAIAKFDRQSVKNGKIVVTFITADGTVAGTKKIKVDDLNDKLTACGFIHYACGLD